jgi:hypothetical protein
MSLVLNVEILGEFKKLTAATQGANKQLTGLQTATQKISSSMGRAFATIGAGLSFAFITRELKEAAKAAVEDAKSQGLLATALKNTTGANNSQIKSVEKSISKLSSQAAVADDELRPAFAKLARATGDVEKSTSLMSLALDIAAGTGKSLDAVTTALSRAVGPDGTTGALERLVPAIKGASDPMAELQRLFEGSAEKAAELDPYQRFQVAIGEVSESVGNSLLPALGYLADWFVDVQPNIQKFLDGLVGALKNRQVDAAIVRMQGALGNLGFTIGTLFGSTQTDQAKGFQNFWIALAGAIETVSNLLAGLLAPISAAFGNTKPLENWLDTLLSGVANVVRTISGSGGGSSAPSASVAPGRVSTPAQAVTININKGNVTAKEIANAVNKSAKTGGAPILTGTALRQALRN